VVIIVSKGWIDTSRYMLTLTIIVMSLVMSDEKIHKISCCWDSH